MFPHLFPHRSGAFTDSKLDKTGPNPKAPGEAVMMSRDSLTVMIEPSGTNGAMKTIAIDDDADKGLTAFKSVKEKNKDGYVELATVNHRHSAGPNAREGCRWRESGVLHR